MDPGFESTPHLYYTLSLLIKIKTYSSSLLSRFLRVYSFLTDFHYFMDLVSCLLANENSKEY